MRHVTLPSLASRQWLYALPRLALRMTLRVHAVRALLAAKYWKYAVGPVAAMLDVEHVRAAAGLIANTPATLMATAAR